MCLGAWCRILPAGMGRTAVIGGGPAGCAAAHTLRAAGREVVLFERAPWVGGRTHTYREGGFQVDTGAGFFTNFYPLLQEYTAELGLSDAVLNIKRSQVLMHDGRAVPLRLDSLTSLFAFEYLGWADKLRLLWYTAKWTLRRGALDLVDPHALAPHDTGSIADEARRALGERTYQFLIRSSIEPFWYFSCEEASRALLVALQANAAGAEFYSYRTGMDTLATVLSRDVETVLDTEARGVEAGGGGVRVRVSTGGAAEETHAFDDVVIATTATVARRLVDGLQLQSVTPFQRKFLASQRYASTIQTLWLINKEDVPVDTAVIMPTGPGEWPVACVDFMSRKYTDPALLPPGREGVLVSFTDQLAREYMDRDDAAIEAEVWPRARQLCPALPERAELRAAFRHREAIPVPEVGRYKLAAQFQDAQRPPVVFAGDYLATATVEGALRTGRHAAEVLLAR